MKRKIIRIDEEKCNGCGICIPSCHEGAMRIIDGKARLVNESLCDGIGACIGHCPEGAIEIIEREIVETHNYASANQDIAPANQETHNYASANQDIAPANQEKHNYPSANQDIAPANQETHNYASANQDIAPANQETHNYASANQDIAPANQETHNYASLPPGGGTELRQWPVQLHLINPQAPYFKNADVLLAADCVAFAMGNFHGRFLKGKSVAIACPKLDSNKESYVKKLTSMIADTRINSLTVVMMEVPCCGGLLHLAQTARASANSNLPIKQAIVNLKGEVIEEEWA